MMGLRIAPAAAAVALLCTLAGASGAAAQSPTCPAPKQAMQFGLQGYVDLERAGGEPTITTLADGTLLYGAHAGTTHFYTPAAADTDTAAFFRHYTGQTYIWRSADGGKSWQFIDRSLPLDNAPESGFSDPDFAIDTAGNVYASEINLLNVAVSKSTDGGRTFKLQNFFGQTITDRQWKAADREDEVYIVGNAFGGGTFPSDPAGNVGHHLYKSVDGGRTFSRGLADGAGLGDIEVDQRDGTLYEAYYSGQRLSMAAYRDIRGVADPAAAGLRPDVKTIASGVDMLAHWPDFDLDRAGNLYITWDESGRGARPAGVWYAFSTDGGRSWSTPARVDNDDRTNTWPWLAVGDPGRVAVAYLEADRKLPNHDAETPGNHPWRIAAGQTLKGLGCDESDRPAFTVTNATAEPVHYGTICQGGTVCQAELVDRRLGDYFTIDVDGGGHLWAAYSDTARGGAVALPGIVHQTGGPTMSKKGAKGKPGQRGQRRKPR